MIENVRECSARTRSLQNEPTAEAEVSVSVVVIVGSAGTSTRAQTRTVAVVRPAAPRDPSVAYHPVVVALLVVQHPGPAHSVTFNSIYGVDFSGAKLAGRTIW